MMDEYIPALIASKKPPKVYPGTQWDPGRSVSLMRGTTKVPGKIQ